MERRALVVFGLVAVALGILLATGLVSRTVSHAIVDTGVGSAEFSADRPFPLWVGITAIVAGTGMILLGSRRRSR